MLPVRYSELERARYPMDRLATLPDDATLHELMRRLKEAGIEAAAVSERTIVEIDLGLPASTGVFLARESDGGRAKEIYEALEAESTCKLIACPACRSEQREHEGRTTCRACGLEFDIPGGSRPSTCKHCQEEVPGGFEICWNCQEPIAG
jgi:hypothetical protein